MIKPVFFICAGVLILCGCKTRLDQPPTGAPTAPHTLNHSQVRLGQTKEAVYVAIGQPDRTEALPDGSLWTYMLKVRTPLGGSSIGHGEIGYVVTDGLIEKQMMQDDTPHPVMVQEVSLAFAGDRLVKIETSPAR